MKRLTTAELDAHLDPSVFPPELSGRLITDRRWSPAFTAQVLVEYRRFLVLAGHSARPVLPSAALDQARRAHQRAAPDDWARLCRTLGLSEHQVTPGWVRSVAQEDGWAVRPGGHEEAYLFTLSLYAQVFGERPPLDVWQFPADPLSPSDSREWSMLRCVGLTLFATLLAVHLPVILATLVNGLLGGSALLLYGRFFWRLRPGRAFLVTGVLLAVLALGVTLQGWPLLPAASLVLVLGMYSYNFVGGYRQVGRRSALLELDGLGGA